MAEVLLLHHAGGLTPGLVALADDLRREGHTVHAPDLFDGKTFSRLEDGVAYSREIGFDERAEAAANDMPDDLVYVGYSLGVMAAQKLTQTRAGAKGAILVSSAVKPEEFGAPWPQSVPVQIHMMENDEWVQGYDLDAAHEIADTVPGAELFLYPGAGHLFADSSSPDYDERAAASLRRRVLEFLSAVG
ncbi:MAG TPA: dienelactone hydrolase family protein [Candidatus Dormibacteraeota bacterium]|nr:dienelactone hydrolase family protein [Candidatus Dormibacteraeota bacterium]